MKRATNEEEEEEKEKAIARLERCLYYSRWIDL